MKVLFEALYTLFAADTNFKAAVGSQFYPGIADQENAVYPYAAYYMITDTADWTFSEDIETFEVQISVYDNSNSASTILDAEVHLRALFDDAILSVTGYDFVKMHRRDTNLQPPTTMSNWHLSVDYEIELQRGR